MLPLHCCWWFHCGLFIRDLLLLCYRLHFLWICLETYGLPLSKRGHYSFMMGI
jgi:hypothetical protein